MKKQFSDCMFEGLPPGTNLDTRVMERHWKQRRKRMKWIRLDIVSLILLGIVFYVDKRQMIRTIVTFLGGIIFCGLYYNFTNKIHYVDEK